MHALLCTSFQIGNRSTFYSGHYYSSASYPPKSIFDQAAYLSVTSSISVACGLVSIARAIPSTVIPHLLLFSVHSAHRSRSEVPVNARSFLIRSTSKHADKWIAECGPTASIYIYWWHYAISPATDRTLSGSVDSLGRPVTAEYLFIYLRRK